MSGSPFRLGPFVGGLNTDSDPLAVAEQELTECVNFELDIDGALKGRPPLQNLAGPFTKATDASATRVRILGSCSPNGNVYMIAACYSDGAGAAKGTYSYNVNTATWARLHTTFAANCIVQYNGIVYMLADPSSATTGLATWDGTTFTVTAPANLTTMMTTIVGGGLAIYKERLWIVPGPNATWGSSRLVFSDAGAPGTYSTTTQFFDIQPGDASNLVDLIVYQDSLLLFKGASTFALTYTSRPTDAEVIKVNNKLGATAPNCVVSYENSVFVMNRGNVYEMTGNFDMIRINPKCPFVYDPSFPAAHADQSSATPGYYDWHFITLLGDRLIAGYYRKRYVYNLRTRTWSEWTSAHANLETFGPIYPLTWSNAPTDDIQHYCGNAVSNILSVIAIRPKYSALSDVNGEYYGGTIDINHSITTKTYDMATPYTFKRLYWWGADVETSRIVTLTVTPYSYQNSSAVTTTSGTPAAYQHLEVKASKGLRYRQIKFRVQMLSTGKTTDQASIFSLSMHTNSKETVDSDLN